MQPIISSNWLYSRSWARISSTPVSPPKLVLPQFWSLKKLNWNDVVFYPIYGSRGCRVFKQGIQNYKECCLKINIPKGNYWILRIGVMGRCQKVPKFDVQSQFSMSKIIGIFLIFFSLRIFNLGAHILLSTFLDNINF